MPMIKRKKSIQQSNPRKPFITHIEELRTRLLWSIFVFLIASCIVYPFSSMLLDWILKPLHQTVYYTSPAGGLSMLIHICLFFGFLFAFPVFVFHLYRFIKPALPYSSIKLTLLISIAPISLTCCGISFAYFVSLPVALEFLQGFSSTHVHSLINVNEYFQFAMQYMLGIALLFQLPLILLLWNNIRPLSSKTLLYYSKYVLILSFIIAAILTPTPDPINQALMAVPIIILYYSSVLLIWLTNKCTKAAT